LRFTTRTTYSLIFGHKASNVLADDSRGQAHVGALDGNVHLPGEWLSSLVAFIATALPSWRDDPRRPAQTGETGLTAQLCAHLNGLTRHAPGWDFLQFKREEPDEAVARRSVDLAVAPSGSLIWLEGREYSEYRTLLPIECKRLPTPPGTSRDEREYLYSQFTTTGGVQRFKAGHHASVHARAAMIGYVQSRDIAFWKSRLDQWIEALVREGVAGWSDRDKLEIASHDIARRVASLRSIHDRESGLDPILLDHIWLAMSRNRSSPFRGPAHYRPNRTFRGHTETAYQA